MPHNPINKLFDRRRPLRQDVEQALAQLAQLAEQRPDLAELAATHAALLRVAFADDPEALPIPRLIMDERHATAKLEAGVPLLRGEHLAFDAGWLRGRYLAFSDALINLPPSRNSTDDSRRSVASAIKQAIKRGDLDVHALAVDVLDGDPYVVADRAAQLDLDAGLSATLLRWTLLPNLEQIALQARPLRENIVWQQGYCPTCGAWPVLAEQRGIEQTRFLRCGLCASEWPIEHLFCPFCQSRAHIDIAYLYDEAQEATQRAMTCERCHCYYKLVTTLAPLPTPLLLVTDLATLHLDLIALERTYAPPA